MDGHPSRPYAPSRVSRGTALSWTQGLVPAGHLPCAHVSPPPWPRLHKPCPCTIPLGKTRGETHSVSPWDLKPPRLRGRTRVELFRDCCEQPLRCCACTNPRTALLIRDKSKNPAQAGSRRRGPVICYSHCRLPRCLCFATRGTAGLIFPRRLHREAGAFLENTF